MTLNSCQYAGISIVVLLGFGLLTSCSEERKREAAKLEQELRAQLASTQDTTPRETIDSVVAETDLSYAQREPATDQGTGLKQSEFQPEVVSFQGAAAETPTATTDRPATETTLTAMMAQSEATGISEPAGPYFTVQVESWESRPFAEQQVAKYRADGLAAFISSVTVSDHTKHRIRIGTFATRTEASQAMVEISSKYGNQPWIDFVK